MALELLPPMSSATFLNPGGTFEDFCVPVPRPKPLEEARQPTPSLASRSLAGEEQDGLHCWPTLPLGRAVATAARRPPLVDKVDTIFVTVIVFARSFALQSSSGALPRLWPHNDRCSPRHKLRAS